MKREWLVPIACVAALAATGCDRESNEVLIEENETLAANEEQPEPLNVESGDLPPMITRSPSYRCADGGALYVDVLTDENAVMVRDSRSDVPTRLTRDSGSEPFTGDDRSLSGTGSEVSYSSPDRPGQICREAET